MSSYPFFSVQDTDNEDVHKIQLKGPEHSYVPPPPRALNGGLFTGEKFIEGAPWANVPVIPDVDYMTNINLRSANPPAQALFQYPGNTRPGNNYQRNTGLEVYKGTDGFNLPYNFSCVSCKTINLRSKECKCQRASFISGNTFGDCECEDKIIVDV